MASAFLGVALGGIASWAYTAWFGTQVDRFAAYVSGREGA